MQKLEQRLGAVHARQRLGIESELAPQVFSKRLNFFTRKTGIHYLR